MLSGVKFIPRDDIDTPGDENLSTSTRGKTNLSSVKGKRRKKSKSSHYSSSDDEKIEKIKKGSKKDKKWYSSDELSSKSSSIETEKKRRNKKKAYDGSSREGATEKSSKTSKHRDLYASEDSSSASDDGSSEHGRHKKPKERKSRQQGNGKEISGDDLTDYGGRYDSLNGEDIRTEMGLEWMLRPEKKTERKVEEPDEHWQKEPIADEIPKTNPRELNPYLRGNGSGYPEDTEQAGFVGSQVLSSSVVGDGGASWRLKALKRAKEQAAREGRKLEEVVEERWGSLGHLAVSVASRTAAPSRVHLNAIKSRQKGFSEASEISSTNQNKRDTEGSNSRDYLKDVSLRNPEMRAPKVQNSLSWGKRKGQSMVNKDDAALISNTLSTLNKYANDGSFMTGMIQKQLMNERKPELDSFMAAPNRSSADSAAGTQSQSLSANQLAAKAFQLRLMGKPEEADRLLKEAEELKAKQDDELSRQRKNEGYTRRYAPQDAIKQKKKEDDADTHIAKKIMRNKQYTVSGQVDDEYDFEDAPSRKSQKKGVGDERNYVVKRIVTQQERCQFCFENPTRPKHLIISIANFTYLMLPPWQPVVPGHCCILPMQHESATRTVDDNVWEEIRNFKKCLIMMFAEQEKDLIFVETVKGLARQRRHCLIECIPVPRDIAKEAPLYFKKAIDEAEDEWSQHNAKKLIDTSEKGLRASIPKDFPYFHVEFGLNKGFVHVIDDETNFRSSFGLDVIRGMLQLPVEDMYRRRKQESVELQKQVVASFVRDWKRFDWTRQLE